MLGDVNGDWSPTGPLRPAERPIASADSPSASLPDIAASARSEVSIPFSIANLRGKTVGSYQFDVEYDPTVIRPAEIAASVAGTLDESLSVVSNSPSPGLLKVAVYGAFPVYGDGAYLNLVFKVTGPVGSTTPLRISSFILNDGSGAAAAIDGQVTVKR